MSDLNETSKLGIAMPECSEILVASSDTQIGNVVHMLTIERKTDIDFASRHSPRNIVLNATVDCELIVAKSLVLKWGVRPCR